jgi:hypothetical protein
MVTSRIGKNETVNGIFQAWWRTLEKMVCVEALHTPTHTIFFLEFL